MKSVVKKVQENWKSGLTVSLVSIPLSLALAITSGATPTQGIITAFWAGLLGAILAGSKFNIIGPTGALAGILISYSLTHGAQTLPIIAIISGALILIAYIFNLDRYIIFIPKSVVYGFTLGVALIIGLGQLDSILGISGIEKGENLIMNTFAILKHWGDINPVNLLIFLVATSFIIFWNKKYPKIPGAVIVAFLAIAAVMTLKNLNIDPSLTTLGDKYSDLKSALHINFYKDITWSNIWNGEIWSISIAVAIISILETLLSGQIADHMTGTKFNRKKEVMALAVANIGSGLAGGIPATAALARTALNIKSGANSNASGIINALFIGLISIFFLVFFKNLPMVIIASILVVVAIGMVEKKHFINLINNEKVSFALSVLVTIIVVADDPITGVIFGTIVALLMFVNKVSYGQTEILLWKDNHMVEALLKHEFLEKPVIDTDIVVYKISGTLTYINMPAHLEAIKKIKHNKYVIISMRHAFYADTDGIDYLEEIIKNLKANNQTVLLSGINKEVAKLLHKTPFYKKKYEEGKIYSRTSDAINAITNR